MSAVIPSHHLGVLVSTVDESTNNPLVSCTQRAPQTPPLTPHLWCVVSYLAEVVPWWLGRCMGVIPATANITQAIPEDSGVSSATTVPEDMPPLFCLFSRK